jgi:rfaE bifunctional protein nucleotidyltransferase chain/domain
MTTKLIALGADHNGVALKTEIKKHLTEQGHHCIDVGPFESQPPVDYVDYATLVATMVHNGDCEFGILMCGTGVGMSIAANKVQGVRAALVHDFDTATKSREHNDANVLCLGAWVRNTGDNLHIADLWLNQKFGELRHVRRVERIDPDPKGKIIFANGCFDILHQGHVQLLKWARNLGDHLVVGINSDASVRALKGPTRPVNSQADRKAVLEALRYVDEVVIFDEDKPTNLIKTLHPDVVVKGGEWLADEVRERDEIPDGVEVKIFPLITGYSTTKIVKSIKGP